MFLGPHTSAEVEVVPVPYEIGPSRPVRRLFTPTPEPSSDGAPSVGRKTSGKAVSKPKLSSGATSIASLQALKVAPGTSQPKIFLPKIHQSAAAAAVKRAAACDQRLSPHQSTPAKRLKQRHPATQRASCSTGGKEKQLVLPGGMYVDQLDACADDTPEERQKKVVDETESLRKWRLTRFQKSAGEEGIDDDDFAFDVSLT